MQEHTPTDELRADILVSVDDAAVRLGVSDFTVHKWVIDGALPCKRFKHGVAIPLSKLLMFKHYLESITNG